MKIVKIIDKAEKRNIKGLVIATFISANFIVIIVTWFYPITIISYDLENYRYLYSSLIQIIGSLVAFIASSTLVVLQLLHSNAPNSAKFFPKIIFTSFLLVGIILLICDVVALLSLGSSVTLTKQFVLNWLIILNIYTALFAFIYVLFVARFLSPKYQIKRIIQEAKKAKTNDDRRVIVYSLEEMFLSAIKKGQGGNVQLYQDALITIIEIFTNTRTDLNAKSKHEPDHPLRIIPNIIERIASSMITNDMPNLLHYNGHILRELSGSKYNENEIVGVEISCAIEHIAKVCLINGRIIDLCNFCSNFIMCADENNGLDTIFWSTRGLIQLLSKHQPKEDISSIFSNIVKDLIYLFDNTKVTDKFEAESLVSFLENQKQLIKIHCEISGNNSIMKEISNIRRCLNEN